jgi:hypothetical protein
MNVYIFFCTIFILSPISLPLPLSYTTFFLPLALTLPPGQDLFLPPVSDFAEEKKEKYDIFASLR